MASMAAMLPRLMMETTFLATSEKLWPPPEMTFGGPFNSPAKLVAKNASMAARPSALSRSPRATTMPFSRMVRRLPLSSKWLRNPASRSSRISIRKWDFAIHTGAAGSKPLGPFSMA